MKYFVLIVFGLALAISPAARADDSEPPTGVVALLCKMSRHAQLMTLTISIDYDKQLVNGITASFSPSMIVWTVENGNKSEHHELNRITGTYTFWNAGEAQAVAPPTFSCEKAPPKF
jgi:hypothetical protein